MPKNVRDQVRERARQNVQRSVADVGESEREKRHQFVAATFERLPRLRWDQLIADPHQIRKVFDDSEIRTLADSIAALGIEDPMKVYPADGGRWMIREGERRWRAVGLLIEEGRIRGDEEIIPVIIEPAPAPTAEGAAAVRVRQLLTSLTKKLFRPLEEIAAIVEIAELNGNPPATELAAMYGLDERVIRNHLRVGRCLSRDEWTDLMAQASDVAFDPLLKLVDWLEHQTAKGLSPESRRKAIHLFAQGRPTAKTVGSLLRALAVQKAPGRVAETLKKRARKERDGSYTVSLKIMSPMADDPYTLRRAADYLRTVVADLERRAQADDGGGT